MHSFKHPQSRTPGRLTVLAIAIASALTAGQVNATVPSYGYNNSATISALDNPQGNTWQGNLAGVLNSGSIGTLSSSGTILGGIGVHNIGIITSLNNQTGSSINSNYTAIVNDSAASIGTLSNSGAISNDYYFGISNNGTITSLNNVTGGTISGANTEINNTGSIGTLSNSGSITGSSVVISNSGTITSLNNNVGGTITGANTGINNTGRIGTLTNNGSITDSNVAISNSGTITSLNNNVGGTVAGGNTGIGNTGTIGTLSNSGTISAAASSGIITSGTIGTLSNSGTISGSSGINNNGSGTITTLNNAAGGTIRGDGYAGIYNDGSIGALNNIGLITGNQYAIYNDIDATLGAVTNSGTIAGAIRNDTAHNLTINGGTGSEFGILTGAGVGGVSAGNIGQITNSFSNLVFGSGNLLLNDNINVSGDPTHTVSNLAATLLLNNTIHINGNYTQGSGASLILGVADNAVTTGNINTDAGYGRLVVSGSANVASGSTIGLQKLGSYGFAQGQRYVVIQANAEGTNYNADTLHYSVAGYNAAGTSVADGSNSDLLVTLGTAAAGATPVNQATSTNSNATLAGLFNYGGLNAGLMNLFNAAAALDSSAAGNHAGAQLSPTANTSAATQASTASTVQVLNVAAAHLDGLRTAQNDSVGSGVATGESARNTGLWGQAFGGSSRLGERDDIAGYHARYSGFLLGADGLVNDSWRAGGLFSYTKTTVNNDGDNSGSSADVKSYGLFGYASYQAQPWYLDLSLGAIQHQYDTQREINFSGFNGSAKGQHDGMQYIASAVAGYPIDLGPELAHTILTPIAGLTYSTLRQDSYTESGGNGAALHLDSSNSTSLKSDLGAKLERSFATSYGSVVPSAQLTWRHEYHDNGLQSVANYAADTSGATSFTSAGAKPVADTGVLTLGVTLLHSENLSLGAKYTLEAANGYTANTGDVQVRWNF